MIRALIFDLDDTLYRECDFVESGFRAVAEHVGCITGNSPAEVHRTMMRVFRREGRRSVLPAVIAMYLGPSASVNELVLLYRRHDPQIRLFPGYAPLLRELRKTYRLGILTDGDPDVQRKKCAALGLTEAVDEILCTWQSGPEMQKPHPYGFLRILSDLHAQPHEALYAGDSVEKDCLGARSVGMKCVLVRREGVTTADAGDARADFVIRNLYQLPPILKKLEDQNEAA